MIPITRRPFHEATPGPATKAIAGVVSAHHGPHPPLFTTSERNLIPTEFMVRFGQPPLVADGIGPRTWHSGPQKGQPKLAKAVASMLERGLVEIGSGIYGRPHARFTAAGLEALRAMARDRRALDPTQYGHILHELGLAADDVADIGAA